MSWSHWHILCQCYLVEYAPRLFPCSSNHPQEFLCIEGRNPFYPAKKAEPGIFRVPDVFFTPGGGSKAVRKFSGNSFESGETGFPKVVFCHWVVCFLEGQALFKSPSFGPFSCGGDFSEQLREGGS